MDKMLNKATNTVELRPCPQVEQALESCGCKQIQVESLEEFKNAEDLSYAFLNQPLPLSDIDIEKSMRTSQNRLDNKLDIETAKHYAVAMSEGDIFPGIVLNDEGELADGFHRENACEIIGATHIKGFYIFKHHNKDLVTGVINLHTTGKRESLSDTVEKAVIAFRRLELEGCDSIPTQKEMARMHRVPESRFNEQYKAIIVKEQLVEEGVDAHKISNTSLVDIGKVIKVSLIDGIELGKIAATFGMKGNQLKDVAKEYLSHHTKDKQAVIKKAKDKYSKVTNNGTMKQRIKRTPIKIFLDDLMRVSQRGNKLGNLKRVQLTPQQRLAADSLLRLLRSISE